MMIDPRDTHLTSASDDLDNSGAVITRAGTKEDIRASAGSPVTRDDTDVTRAGTKEDIRAAAGSPVTPDDTDVTRAGVKEDIRAARAGNIGQVDGGDKPRDGTKR